MAGVEGLSPLFFTGGTGRGWQHPGDREGHFCHSRRFQGDSGGRTGKSREGTEQTEGSTIKTSLEGNGTDPQKFIWRVKVPSPGLVHSIPVGLQDPAGPYWEHWVGSPPSGRTPNTSWGGVIPPRNELGHTGNTGKSQDRFQIKTETGRSINQNILQVLFTRKSSSPSFYSVFF